jgi:hypothetical protein
MIVYVTDALGNRQALSVQLDGSGNLALGYCDYVLNSAGIAVPVSPSNPMPVTAPSSIPVTLGGNPVSDGSGAIVAGEEAQTLFSGITPVNGYQISNNSQQTLWFCDVGTATDGGGSVPLLPNETYVTPYGYKPPGPVSIFGQATAQAFAARRW